MDRDLWKIIPVEVLETGGIYKFDFKVPSHFKTLTGIMFSAVQTYVFHTAEEIPPPGGYRPHIVYGFDDKNNLLGNVSLHINSMQINPVQYPVYVKMFENLKRKYLSLPLNEPLKGGTLIQGHFIDVQNSSRYNYTLNIYLKGK